MSDLVKRALHTFYQAAIPVFLAGVTNLLGAFQHGGLSTVKSAGLALVIATVAAGLSAIKTAYLTK